MQLHADKGPSTLDRRKRIQSAQRNDLSDFLQQRVSVSAGQNQSRPIPPFLGNGEAVDLLKLFVHVKKRGGYDVISRDGFWEEVGEDQGLTCSGLGSAIKLIYYKYFLSSRIDSTKVSGAIDSAGNLDLEGADMMCFVSGHSKERKTNGEESEEGSTDGGNLCNVKRDWTFESEEVEVIEIDSSDDERASVDKVVSKPDDVVNVESFSREEIDEVVVDLSVAKEEGSSRNQKRKRDSTLSNMLDWLAGAAKDPVNPAIGTLPESSKWKSYGVEHCWKQVLAIRTALFCKKSEGLSPEQAPWQKKAKVHPSLFDEAGKSAEKVRSSPRLQFPSSLETASNHISSLSSFNLRKRIPVGQFFQAELPEWTGVPTESDSKWLGTRIWPPKEKESLTFVLEDDPVHKKTRNSYTREIPGSLEGIRSHVSRKRMKLKVELGSAFYSWKFDKMGEEAATSWTRKDEKRFESVVKDNPLTQGKCFWDELSITLPTKSRQELVSYYFNVFLLRRRAHQNRYIPSNIDSDDDETEFIAKSSSLIFSPGKKKNVD